MDPSKWELDDGEARAHRYPTFRIPTRMWRESLRPPAFVKLIFLGVGYQADERMWVQITARTAVPSEGEDKLIHYRGVLKSKPATLQGIDFGDELEFGPEHVIDVD